MIDITLVNFFSSEPVSFLTIYVGWQSPTIQKEKIKKILKLPWIKKKYKQLI
jgi:hypothetical protein